MLYLIGGVARSGKSMLARRMLLERHVPSLSLDVVMMGFSRGLPTLGIRDQDLDAVVAEKLWPFTKAMALTLVEDEVDYLLEGVQLEPVYALELLALHPRSVRACFLGYAQTTPEEKLSAIRAHAGLPNNWLSNASEAEILDFSERMIDRSARIQRECRDHGLQYFDTSADFDAVLDAAVGYLVAADAEHLQ